MSLIIIKSMKKLLVIFLILSLFSSCKQTYLDLNKEILAKDISKIQFTERVESQCEYFEPFEITDKRLIKEFIDNMNNSIQEGLWKGACNSEIKLITKDTIYTYLTFGEVFGISGKWYTFPDEKIMDKIRNKNKRLTRQAKLH